MRDRIKYLDLAKFIGIFCIYLGHMGNLAGNAYHFVFTFHVPLFFFLSGCTETLASNVPWYKYILKNVKTLLIPCYFFALVFLLVHSISINSHATILPNIIVMLKGCIRNQYFGGLWFLTCLFVIKIAFFFIRKLLKFNLLVLVVCLGLFVIAEMVIDPTPLAAPRMIYNVDSALYYIFFYALGYCCFDKIHCLFALDRTYKKIVFASSGLVCFVYSALRFFGKNLLSYININVITNLFCTLLGPMLTIFLIFILSKLLEEVKIFEEIGENTLFLCGSEFVVRLLIPNFLQIFGLSLAISNPLAAYLYAFALLVVCNKTLVPLEKMLFKKFRLLK